jgi:hypothetical protein
VLGADLADLDEPVLDHDEVAAVYHFDTVAGVDFSPTEYVDILERARIATAYRGFQSGVDHAEGFVPCRTWLRNRTTRLLP